MAVGEGGREAPGRVGVPQGVDVEVEDLLEARPQQPVDLLQVLVQAASTPPLRTPAGDSGSARRRRGDGGAGVGRHRKSMRLLRYCAFGGGSENSCSVAKLEMKGPPPQKATDRPTLRVREWGATPGDGDRQRARNRWASPAMRCGGGVAPISPFAHRWRRGDRGWGVARGPQREETPSRTSGWREWVRGCGGGP